MAAISWNVGGGTSAGIGGDGVWDLTTVNWFEAGDVPGSGSSVSFTNGDSVSFNAESVNDLPYTVTLSTGGVGVTLSGLSNFGSSLTLIGDPTETLGLTGVIQANGVLEIAVPIVSGDIQLIGFINGSDVLTLSGTHTTTGALSLESNIIQINGEMTQLGSVFVGERGTLSGSGIIRSTSTVIIEGTLAGSLTFDADVNINDGVAGALMTSVADDTIQLLGTAELTQKINSGFGDDTITSSSGSIITGTVLGSRGDDLIFLSGAVNGTVRGGAGDDTINLSDSAGFAAVVGGRGNDILTGGTAGALLRGGRGNDTITMATGTTTDSKLEGGDGNDTIICGDGNDLIYGGADRDLMTGGGGADLFTFRDFGDFNATGAADRITDFTQGQDVIRLHGIDADSIASGNQNFTFIGNAGFSGTAGELRAKIQNGQTVVRGDVDGDGVADFAVVLTGEMTLTADDFAL
jgi:Ca2+-binding RTX toxin-like protein